MFLHLSLSVFVFYSGIEWDFSPHLKRANFGLLDIKLSHSMGHSHGRLGSLVTQIVPMAEVQR